MKKIRIYEKYPEKVVFLKKLEEKTTCYYFVIIL